MLISAKKYNMIESVANAVKSRCASDLVSVKVSHTIDLGECDVKVRWELGWASTSRHSEGLVQKFINDLNEGKEFVDYLNSLELQFTYDIEDDNVAELRALMKQIGEDIEKRRFDAMLYRWYVERILGA